MLFLTVTLCHPIEKGLPVSRTEFGKPQCALLEKAPTWHDGWSKKGETRETHPSKQYWKWSSLRFWMKLFFLATFNKQSNRVLDKYNNTFLKKKPSNYNLISSHSRLSFFKGSLSSPHIAVFCLRSTCPIARSNYIAPENQHSSGKSTISNWKYNGYRLGCSPSKDAPDHQDLLHFLKH